jgi:phosphoglycolate phosphatase-like HAD superfamily hydrolase
MTGADLVPVVLPDAMIFDLDGTLVDTNGAHVEAWRLAFRDFGFDVPRERIVPEIGKGGDKVVPTLLGAHVDERQGDAIRDANGRHFLAIARASRFDVFPGARELLSELRRRRVRTALATSGKREYLEATERSSGLDVESLVDVVVTKTEGASSKPAPDLVVSAVDELGLAPEQCAMVGDTIYDGEACTRAGVAFLGLLCGGSERDRLVDAGARGVYADPADLLAHLDQALQLAAPAAR